MRSVLAFSGGNDSTAMALRLAELGEEFSLLFTPAGNEPAALFDHVEAVAAAISRPIIRPANRSLMFWIEHHGALPNWRQRWCTRQIKIEPCIAWLLEQTDPITLSVGLRADEEDRGGIYGSYATYRYPLREWGWNRRAVLQYLDSRDVHPPQRTNCKLCYDQQLGEWWELWRADPEEWARGELLEERHGHTFRSPGRDTWPAALKDLRARFEAGDVPRGADVQMELFRQYERCRVCVD
jgi:hypothetical protein